jgi:diguanylate cyclase (GGDEF)-like protein
VLLPDIIHHEAADVARRIIATVAEPFEFAPGARVGASIGLASAPRDGDTADELLSAADRAMYDAKRRGKGDFVVYAGLEAVGLVPSADAHAGFAFREMADSAA